MQSKPRLAIIGPGLLGGSIGLSCREEYDVRFWGRNSEKLTPITEAGFFSSTDLAAVIDKAVIIILCIPVPIMCNMAQRLIDAGLTEKQLISDVGSVKGSVLNELQPIFGSQGFRFIGSHPMAGSELTGFQAATASLLKGASCILTPDEFTSAEDLQALHTFWQKLGMVTYELSASAHDSIISRVSHVPHILAAVCSHVALQPESNSKFAGGGLRDTSRVASGHAGLWTGILSENQESIVPHLDETIVRLQHYREALKDNDVDLLHHLLEEDKQKRDQAYSLGSKQ